MLINTDGYAPGTVIRWETPRGAADHVPPLRELLLARPGSWALVAEAVNEPGWLLRGRDYLALQDKDRFEVELVMIGDGESGVLYNIYARSTVSEPANPPGLAVEE